MTYMWNYDDFPAQACEKQGEMHTLGGESNLDKKRLMSIVTCVT